MHLGERGGGERCLVQASKARERVRSERSRQTSLDLLERPRGDLILQALESDAVLFRQEPTEDAQYLPHLDEDTPETRETVRETFRVLLVHLRPPLLAALGLRKPQEKVVR